MKMRMLKRQWATAIAASAAATSAFAWAGGRDQLRTVPRVEVARYVGDWYQIAHIPQWFEGRGPCACARQRLALTNDGRLSVWNTCNAGSPEGALREIRGYATSDDRTTNAKFRVDFGLPFRGTYWVIGLDEQYRYAVVSDRGKRTFYILSKTPTLARELYQQALAKGAEQLDASELKITQQEGCRYP